MHQYFLKWHRSEEIDARRRNSVFVLLKLGCDKRGVGSLCAKEWMEFDDKVPVGRKFSKQPFGLSKKTGSSIGVVPCGRIQKRLIRRAELGENEPFLTQPHCYALDAIDG